jgi:hypothetical protein
MNRKRLYFHGECFIKEIGELPDKLLKREDNESITIAESETVGNEHRIKIKEGVEFFEDEKGTLYMRNTVPTEVYCLHTERHDTIEIPQGVWEIDRAVEYDYLNQLERVVTD